MISGNVKQGCSLLENSFEKPKLAQIIKQIQELERDHLQLRAQINDKMVKLYMQRFDLGRKKQLGEVEDAEIEMETAPKQNEIDQLRREESLVLEDINSVVSRFRRKGKKLLEDVESSDYDDEY